METQRIVIELLHRVARMLHRRHHHHPGSRRGHPGQARLFALLAGRDGAGQSEIAEELGVRPASLSELLDRLEEAGLAERRHSDTDKRAARVFLTDEGKKMAEETSMAGEEFMKGMFDAMTEQECAQLVGLLEKLVENMERSAPWEKCGHDRHETPGARRRHGCRHGSRERHGECEKHGGCGHGSREKHGNHGCHDMEHDPREPEKE